MVKKLIDLVGGSDLIEIYGKSGSGKSTLGYEFVKYYLKQGKKVLYIDTEKNFDVKPEGFDYIYEPDFNKLMQFVAKELPKTKYDLIIYDSLGLPILGKFAEANQKERGEMLLGCEAISNRLKIYAKEKNALVIVLNQPVSEMGKTGVLPPFGDKSSYFYKEIWRTILISTDPFKTVCSLVAYRSRKFGREKELARISITSKGIEVEEKI